MNKWHDTHCVFCEKSLAGDAQYDELCELNANIWRDDAVRTQRDKLDAAYCWSNNGELSCDGWHEGPDILDYAERLRVVLAERDELREQVKYVQDLLDEVRQDNDELHSQLARLQAQLTPRNGAGQLILCGGVKAGYDVRDLDIICGGYADDGPDPLEDC